MVELTLTSGDKKKKDETIAGQLPELGVHIFVDQDYHDSRENIKQELESYFADDLLKELKLSPVKTALMNEVKRRLRYAWFHVPRGKAAERKWFAKKMIAMRRILLRAEEDILAGSSDDNTVLVVRDSLAKADTLVGFTFDTANSTIQKAFVIERPAAQQGIAQPSMIPVQQIQSDVPKPDRTKGEYAGRNPNAT